MCSHKVEQCLWQNVGTIVKVISTTHNMTDKNCFVGNKIQDCKLGLFQDASFAGDLQDSNQLKAEYCAYLDHKRLFKILECAQQTSVSHSSAKSGIISLDAGLRMEGTPWDARW